LTFVLGYLLSQNYDDFIILLPKRYLRRYLQFKLSFLKNATFILFQIIDQDFWIGLKKISEDDAKYTESGRLHSESALSDAIRLRLNGSKSCIIFKKNGEMKSECCSERNPFVCQSKLSTDGSL